MKKPTKKEIGYACIWQLCAEKFTEFFKGSGLTYKDILEALESCRYLFECEIPIDIDEFLEVKESEKTFDFGKQ